MKPTRLVPIMLSLAAMGVPAPARAYDMDCAIMLCMAGGFPSSAVCAAAHAEMIRRITPWPSLPPFGICSFAALPAAEGWPGGTRAIDISTADYAWLRRTRVIWWRGWTHRTRYGPQRWGWTIHSCDHENRICRMIEQVSDSETPWPDTFVTENGQAAPTPRITGTGHVVGRAVMIEYGDYEGALGHTEWRAY